MFVCSKKEAILDMLYGEGISPEDRDSLRSHIDGCANCSAELSDLSFARSEVNKYVEQHFSPLETPHIEWRPEKLIVGEIRPPARKLFHGIRFEWLPRFAFASIFLLAVLAVSGLLIYRQPIDSGSVAVNLDHIDNAALQRPAQTERAEERPAVSGPENDQDRFETGRAVQLKERVLQNRTKGRPASQSRPRADTASPAARKRPIQFDGFEEFADESLRLSDILEQIGG